MAGLIFPLWRGWGKEMKITTRQLAKSEFIAMSQSDMMLSQKPPIRKAIVITLAILLCLPSALAQAQGIYPTNWDYYSQLEARRQVILSALAGQTWMEGDDFRRRVYLGVVKLHTGVDSETGLQYLWDSVNDSAHWGSFNVYSIMDAVLRFEDKLPPEWVAKAKRQLAYHFRSDKGFTENHKLQYRTARYLYGQTWPRGPVFGDGMTPVEAMNEAESWIDDWIDRTVSVGMYEFDSVNYHSLYYLCLTTLYDFSKDPLMKRKAWMMMQLLLADWAPEYLEGNWIGAHSREKYNQVTHTVLNCGTAIPFGYLFFGDSSFHPELPETYFVGLAAVQGFKPLWIIGSIATDRSEPYVHKETKAPRRGLGINKGNMPVWKYDYVTRDYALGSSYGDISAVENHRWDLTWTSPKDGSTCFFINPSYSAKQLLTYFADAPDKIIANILRQRPYYKDRNKWVEGSPFEEVFQHQNTLIALYNIPEDERNGHVNGFFSKIIKHRVEHPSGWIFCMADSVYFAVKTLMKGIWHEEDDHYRLTLNSRQTGVVMEVANKSQYSSFEAFQQQIMGNRLQIDMEALRVVYTNSNGDRLDFTHGKDRLINGEKVIFDNWPLFGGPFVKAKKESKLIEIQYGVEKVVLNFNNYDVKFEGIE